MNTTHRTRTTIVGLTVSLAAAVALSVGATGPAMASDLIAADSTVAEAAPAVAGVPTALASRPRTIVVTQHDGRSVTLFAKGERIRRVLAPGAKPAVFTGLTPGRTYTVAIGGQPIGAVVALDAPNAASGLQVRATSTPGTVRLSWRHTPTTGTGGRTISYDVSASSPGLPAVRTSVRGARTATLTGLRPDVRYAFSVVPRNSAGRGKATTATMSRTLGELTGTAVPTTPTPTTPAPTTPTPPTPAATPTVPVSPAPAPAPAPAPRPTTRTIWVCPDGYTEADGMCRQSKAYTFHTEAETAPYTYHSEQQLNTINVPAVHNGTIWTWSCPSGYSDGGGQWGVGVCKGTVTVSVKDAPPLGWYDTGSSYARDVEVRDDMPEGYLDDGTQWVRTTAKVAREVPA